MLNSITSYIAARMPAVMSYVAARMQEPSTMAGFAAIAVALHIMPDNPTLAQAAMPATDKRCAA
jgi:hypothetical protein